MKEMLDEKDWAILEGLKKNSRLSEQKLAKKTGIPMTTVHNRIRKLREAGIIEAYTVKLDYAKLGEPLTAFVLVKTAQGADQKEALHYISKMPHVYEAAMVTGEFDILFKARVPSMEKLNEVVVQKLRKKEGIGDTRTMICYEVVERG